MKWLKDEEKRKNREFFEKMREEYGIYEKKERKGRIRKGKGRKGE